jgi:hypothetical protein
MGMRLRFWIELAVGGIALLVCLLTVISPEWIEGLFKVEPDGGSGELEWAIVGVLFSMALTLSLMARTEWRRAHVV